MIKNILVAGLLLLSTPVVAADCATMRVDEAVEAIQTADPKATFRKLDSGLSKKIVDVVGEPPVTGPYEFWLVQSPANDSAAVAVVQGECINEKTRPLPTEVLNRALGLVDAGNI